MEAYQPKSRGGPEAAIQAAVIKMLDNYGWFVKELHGNAYQSGMPDLFACHAKYGHRLIEIKNDLAYSFTPAQLRCFPAFCSNGSGVWILIAATEIEYKKLFKPPNWFMYLSNIRKYINPR